MLKVSEGGLKVKSWLYQVFEWQEAHLCQGLDCQTPNRQSSWKACRTIRSTKNL